MMGFSSSRVICIVLTAVWISTNASTLCAVDRDDSAASVLGSEFVFETASFAQCHASTIVSTPSGLVAAWFAGTKEGHSDVGVWVSRKTEKSWSPPVEVANGIQSANLRHPCWNPVLFLKQKPNEKPTLVLYYKVGPSPSQWWGMSISSTDDGVTWNSPVRLPEGILGPIKNKPVQWKSGTLVSGSSTEDKGWRVRIERSEDLGKTWSRTDFLNDGTKIGAIQPTILNWGERLQILCRSRQGQIAESWSNDGGTTWQPMSLTSLPNNNSGLDGVTLKDGRALLVYNHTTKGRSPLNVSLSRDGKQWNAALVLENQPGEYSYPAVIQADDGIVHIVYTWKRQRIRHVAIDPMRLVLHPLADGAWPKTAVVDQGAAKSRP